MALVANQYTTDHVSTTSTGRILSVNFGFNAAYVRIANRGTLPLRVSLQSSAASTDDDELRSGEIVEYRMTATHVCGVFTTSTSTDGYDRRDVTLTALGN